ncbi:hypothetical protein BX666DRAFT_1908777 [Dichotomocladium elegans]|nr:hypothetical protein BX666DRAFT_1908777 [Dichotomocladium elegans]
MKYTDILLTLIGNPSPILASGLRIGSERWPAAEVSSANSVTAYRPSIPLRLHIARF